MGLLNDVRFYLMVALAILFLLVVAMCSSAYDPDPDGHASSGVTQGSTAGDDVASVEATDQSADKVVEEAGTAAESTTVEETTEVAETETTATQAVAATATAAVAATAVAATDSEANEATTEAETSADASEGTGDSATESATVAENTEATMTEIKVEAFQLSELANSGESVTDFGTDLGNLKSDMGRFSGRVDEATSMFDKVREMIAK